MAFRKFALRFVDSCSFFLEPLRKISKTYDIDTVKGHFPHHNKPENQKYIGCIPCEEDYGVRNFTPEDYEEDFKPWHAKQKHITNWSFKDEMVKYCSNSSRLSKEQRPPQETRPGPQQSEPTKNRAAQQDQERS